MTLESIAGAAGAWLWDKYGQAIADRAIGVAKERWAKFNWSQAADKYRQRIKQIANTTRILGNPNPISVKDIYTDVYLLDKPTAMHRYDLEQLQTMAIERDTFKPSENRQDALVLARRNKRLFILGKPGAGKTTLLKYIALQAINNKINKIPIFVSLKEWSDTKLKLMTFLVRQFDICAFPEAQPFIEYILESGQAIVLFDGLDEVNIEGEERARIIVSVTEFSRKYPFSSCLITCRNAASEYIFEQFTYVEMADFDGEQVQRFVHKWFQDDTIKAEKILIEFDKPAQRGLRDLARIPLLLTLLCLAFNETMSFPQRRVELYEEALDALLKKWDSSRNIKRDEIYRKLSLGRKQQMLARIAAETFEEGIYFLPQKQLVKRINRYLQKLPPTDFDEDIDGEAVLRAIEAQHGLLVERAQRIYSFSHLTFQEYFTAKYIAEDTSEGTLARVISQHLTDNRWREVFLLIASLLPNADNFFTLMKNTIDDIIRNDKKLISIIQWAQEKAGNDYLTLGPYGRGVALDLTLNHDHYYDYKQNYDLLLDRTLTLLLDFALEREYTLRLTNVCNRACDYAKDLNLTHLLRDLKTLTIPNQDSGETSWQKFISDLRLIMITYRNIGHDWWILTKKQQIQIEQYQEATYLLLNCLNLAYVSDRVRIENSLWLLPREKP